MAKSKKTIRKYYKKSRWSSNISPLSNEIITAQANSLFFGNVDLATNPVQSTATVSQQYTVKNFIVSYEIEAQADLGTYIESLCAYIMFVPQGMTISSQYPQQHPEYIMACKFLGSPNAEGDRTPGTSALIQNPGRNPLTIRTRLARRLQTGDKVILLITGTNTLNQNISLQFNGLIRWWTKAN